MLTGCPCPSHSGAIKIPNMQEFCIPLTDCLSHSGTVWKQQ